MPLRPTLALLRRLLSLAAFLVVALGFTAALTAPSTARAQVKASLVAAETSIQPGRAFTVALRLEHEPHWHTYWINAGTGYPTSLEWQLPPGWTAGEIEWPTPHVVRDTAGNIAGNGYENDTLLPVTITPPADLKPGETITLSAKADWLMCEAVCKPGKADVSVTLPVSSDKPKPNESTRSAFAAIPSPSPADDLTFTATRSGKTITLTIDGPRAASLTKPHVFTSDAFVQYDEPQKESASADRLTLTLPVSPSYDGKGDKLLGVLAYTNASGAHRGLTLDVPISTTSASVSGSRLSALDSQPQAAAGGLLGTLALAFVGGLILNLMPCVFPVLGIKILGFVNQAGSDRRKVTLHGIVFSLGVLASFWSLAGVLAILQAGGAKLGWGFQLQYSPFVFVLAAVMLVFALSLSGVFEFGLRATGVGANLQSKSGYGGSFFTGILATVAATPCSAPFLAPALGAAVTLPIVESFAVFTTIAIGLSFPYLLLSIFPAAIKALPRPGAWMETFKQFMAFPLYATVAFLIWILSGQSEGREYMVLFALAGLTLIALGAWLYGRYNAPGAKPARARLGLIGGLVLLAAGAAVGWPRAAAPTDLVWEKWSPEAVAKVQAAGKTAYVDFTARWCFTCQTNKAAVFGSADVKKLIRDKSIVLLKGDWTNQDPQITAELARFNRSAVPFNLIYKPASPEPLILPELLTAGTVLDALR